MQSIGKIYRDLLFQKEMMQSSDIIKRYLELGSQSELSLSLQKEMEDILHNKEFKSYQMLIKNINNIQKPIAKDFYEKIAYIKSSSIRPHKLTLDKDAYFNDRASIFLWYASLVSLYMQKKIVGKKEKEAIFNLYQYSLGEDSYSTRFFLLQFALGMDKDAFCDFLGIKPYLYLAVSRVNCPKEQLLEIYNRLTSVSLTSLQLFQTTAFYGYYESLYNEIEKLKKGNTEKKVKRNVLRKIDFALLTKRKKELKQYVVENKTCSIPTHACFSDGSKMSAWLSRIIYVEQMQDLSDEDKKRYQKEYYEILSILYNKEGIEKSINPLVGFDYGFCLKKAFQYYYIFKEQIFSVFSIPSSIFQLILDNKFIPTPEIINAILSFLRTLPCDTEYHKEVVREAITSYERLLQLNLKGDTLDYQIYSASREEEYLKFLSDIDLSLLEKVKKDNYDWYMKFITYYFIFKTTKKRPSMQSYFYDGSIICKWYPTQLRLLKGPKEEVSLFKKLQNLLQTMDTEKEIAKEMTKDYYKVLSQIDAILFHVLKEVELNGEIGLDASYNGMNLQKSWEMISSYYKKDVTPFADEQLKEIKHIRHLFILNQKQKNTEAKDITFGYELSCFADSLQLSYPKLGELLNISFYVARKLCANFNMPGQQILQRMYDSLQKIDKSSYRIDQIEDIEHFKSYLLSVLKKYKETKEARKHIPDYPFPITGILTQDLPSDILKRLENKEPEWYKEFLKIYQDIFSPHEDVSINTLFLYHWYSEEIYKVSKGESTKEKNYLLGYLNKLLQKRIDARQEKFFINRFPSLESFVYKNKRIPYPKELILPDGVDGETFYRLSREMFHGQKNYYAGISPHRIEQFKLLMQYINYCQRSKYSYDPDHIENGQFYIGERLNNIRICLQCSLYSFSKELQVDKEELNEMFSNRKPLSYEFVLSLLRLFKELEPTFREDQIREVHDFIQVLKTGVLNEGITFKLK